MDNFKKKKSRGVGRTLTKQVTQDPNDSTNELIDSSELIAHLKKKVTQAEIWECPLEFLGDILQLAGIVHQGIVLTMEDGKKYIVHKLPSGCNDGGGDAVVSKASNMGKHWSFVRRKDIRTAKLEDYLEKCGDRYDTVTDNCLHAVARMWSLQ